MARVGTARPLTRHNRRWIRGMSEFDVFVLQEAQRLRILRNQLTGRPWAVDHMVPLRAKRASGLHCAANLQVIPQVVNQWKGTRMVLASPLIWLGLL